MRISRNQYEQFRYLNFSTAVLAENYLWTVAMNFNALYRINRKTLEAEEVAIFEDDLLGMELYERILHIENKLYLIPGKGSNIAVYDLKSNTMKYLYARDEGICPGCKFGAVFNYGKYIYLFPQCLQNNNIFKIDILSHEVEYIGYLYEEIDGQKGHVDQFMYGVFCGEYAWIALGNQSGIARFDFKTEKLDIFKFRTVTEAIRDICVYKNKLLLLDWNGNVIEYDPKIYVEKYIWLNSAKGCYSKIVIENNKIWLLPSTSEQIVSISLDGFSVSSIELSAQCITWLRWGRPRAKMMDYLVEDGIMYLFPACLNVMIMLDLEKEELLYQNIMIEEKKYRELCRIYAEHMRPTSIILEERDFLTDFLKDIIWLEEKTTKKIMGDIGKKIYRRLGG